MKYRLYRRTPAAWDHSGVSWYAQAYVDKHGHEHRTGWARLPELRQEFSSDIIIMTNYGELIATSDIPFTRTTHPELFI